MRAAGELLFSLILLACFWPTFLPSTWREPVDGCSRLIHLIQFGIALSGVLGCIHALIRLT